ncbi:MAG: response regulator [Bryobacterales bacterium]|nr:response regulator [Bryobacterales bacterium]
MDTRDALLVISSFEEDHTSMGHVFRESNWTLRGVRTCREAAAVMRENPPPVVICERDLPDGNWKGILRELTLVAHPPALIVTSRLADEYLWVEVLNLGGYDVVAKPLAEREVRWAVDSAWRHWNGNGERSKRARNAIP